MRPVTSSPKSPQAGLESAGSPKIKPYYLSLEPLVNWLEVPRPIDWTEQFGRAAPLEVEIGYGNGEFITRRAKAHPDCDFVGLEVTWASTKRALRRIAKEGLKNVRLLMIDAHLAFQRLFRPRSLPRVIALFPPPWPKDRHVHRRLFSREFLRLVNSRLTAGGRVQVITDYRPYLDWLLEQVPGTGFQAGWQRTPARFDTKYERKWLDHGQDFFYEITLDKTEHLDLPLVEDTPLIILRVKDLDPDRLEPRGQTGPITVLFRDFVYDPRREKGLVLAMINEDRLRQNLWIEIVRTDQDWLIRPTRGGALPTVGLQRALELVRDAAQDSATKP